jgi:autotransporter-associated beta strand protein
MNNRNTTTRYHVRTALATAALVGLLSGAANAQTIQRWTGAAGANWNSTSWTTNTSNPGTQTTPVSGDLLDFRNTLTGGNPTNRTNNNDFVGLSVASITMNNGNPSYTLNGNQLTLAGSIHGGGSGSNTINLDLVLSTGASHQFTGAGAGGMFTINGAISETGGSRQITHQGGSITLNGANSFSGLALIGNATGTNSIYINTLANAGTSQSLGQGTVVQIGNTAASSLSEVIYTGTSAATTDKQWRVGSSTTAVVLSGAFRNNGSGAVTWTGTQASMGSVTANTKTLILGGTNTGNNTWQSNIANGSQNTTVAFTKQDAGKWILAGTNTYTGATSVQQGVLLVDGSIAAGSAVSVSSAAVFGGNGTVNGNLSLLSGALFAFDAGSTLDLAGTLTLDSSFAVASLRNTSGTAVDWANVAQGTYTLMNTSFSFNDTNISNFGANQAIGLAGGKTAYFQQGSGPSSLQLVVVPEPAALSLAAIGVAISGWAAWQRRRG